MSDSPSRYKATHVFTQLQQGVDTSRHIVDGATIDHDHDFFEIAFIVSGSGLHISANGEQQAKSGDGWILAPGSWHAYRDCQNLEVFNCCFSPALLERELVALRHDAAANHIFFQGPLALQRRGIIAFNSTTTDSLVASWSALHSSPSSLIRIARLLLFLGELANEFPTPHRAPLENTQHPAVTRALELLENEMQEEWTLKSLADHLHLAPGYVARRFKEATGLSPLMWLHRLRCERAAQLLLQTNLPIAEIGERVGWNDPNLFARRFRAAYGVSASLYRARFRSGEG
ncbi:AraC family transcriptional regulator [bacterium]|nr:MAG: AraC family transcriptional regulator [bacterium]